MFEYEHLLDAQFNWNSFTDRQLAELREKVIRAQSLPFDAACDMHHDAVDVHGHKYEQLEGILDRVLVCRTDARIRFAMS